MEALSTWVQRASFAKSTDKGFAKSLHRGHSSNIRPVKLCMHTLVKTFCADVTNEYMHVSFKFVSVISVIYARVIIKFVSLTYAQT